MAIHQGTNNVQHHFPEPDGQGRQFFRSFLYTVLLLSFAAFYIYFIFFSSFPQSAAFHGAGLVAGFLVALLGILFFGIDNKPGGSLSHLATIDQEQPGWLPWLLLAGYVLLGTAIIAFGLSYWLGPVLFAVSGASAMSFALIGFFVYFYEEHQAGR